MEINYLWDTNTAIYFLQDQFPKHAAQYIDRILVDEQPAISVISEMDYFAGIQLILMTG
jgi:hypothetical protein